MLLAVGASTPTYHYHLDSEHSTVSAKVGFLGLASKTARFPTMSGAITLQPDRLDSIDLDVELDASALTAGDKVTLERLKGKDFFDVEHYPSVHFSGTQDDYDRAGYCDRRRRSDCTRSDASGGAASRFHRTACEGERARYCAAVGTHHDQPL